MCSDVNAGYRYNQCLFVTFFKHDFEASVTVLCAFANVVRTENSPNPTPKPERRFEVMGQLSRLGGK